MMIGSKYVYDTNYGKLYIFTPDIDNIVKNTVLKQNMFVSTKNIKIAQIVSVHGDFVILTLPDLPLDTPFICEEVENIICIYKLEEVNVVNAEDFNFEDKQEQKSSEVESPKNYSVNYVFRTFRAMTDALIEIRRDDKKADPKVISLKDYKNKR